MTFRGSSYVVNLIPYHVALFYKNMKQHMVIFWLIENDFIVFDFKCITEDQMNIYQNKPVLYKLKIYKKLVIDFKCILE